MLYGNKKPYIGNTLVLIFSPTSKKRVFYALMVLVWFAAQSAIAAEDDYLKALESEADNTGSLITKKQTTVSPAVNSSRVTSAAKENFEKLLEFELPSTYKFYTKLNPKDQIKVVTRYDQEKKLSAASKLIFDLYFENNKKK